jgi:DNA-binding response OmpR family regulator
MLPPPSATLDLRTRRLEAAGRGADLSASEFALAEVIFRHPGQVLSRAQLLDHVWSYDFDPGSNIVDVYVGYLRKKIGPERISAVRGRGQQAREGEPAQRCGGGQIRPPRPRR